MKDEILEHLPISVTNDLEIIEYLIESAINVDAADNNGDTALHIAALRGTWFNFWYRKWFAPLMKSFFLLSFY